MKFSVMFVVLAHHRKAVIHGKCLEPIKWISTDLQLSQFLNAHDVRTCL